MGLVVRAAALALFLLALTASGAWAQATPPQTFTVNSTADATDASTTDNTCSSVAGAPGPCTLRAATMQANANPSADTIVVPPNTYTLTLSGGSVPDDAFGDLDITQPVTINGGGARSTVVNQAFADRVMEVATGVSGVTIGGLTLTGGQPDGLDGAGLLSGGSGTVLTDSAVRGNSALVGTDGAGIANTGTLTVQRSLVTNNDTPSTGGGIFNNGTAVILVNSTISGNTASDGSAILDTNGIDLAFTTITGNTATSGAAVSRTVGGRGADISNSILANNNGPGGNCAGIGFKTAGHNIESATSCGFTGASNGDRQNTDPLLNPLAYSSASDQTETHSPQFGSPAIDGGSSVGCPAVDQRNLPRPFGPACDIGAVEIQQSAPPPPTPAALFLEPATAERTPGETHTVTARALNNDGSPAAGRSVRFEIMGPNEGAGEVTTDANGRAEISWKGVREGTDTISAYVDTNGNLTPEPTEPTGQASVAWTLPTPEQGSTANIEPVSGRVRITVKSGSGKVSAAGATSLLTEARQVPLSTVVDTRAGRVRMTTAANSAGGVQKAEFYGGVYTTRQSSTSGRPVTELRLTESLICRSNRSSKVTASRARSRRLWGRGRGRYRTRGRYSTATVRGTIWLQKDTCTKTTTVVREGVVDVRDIAKRRTVRVRAGGRYVARRASRRR